MRTMTLFDEASAPSPNEPRQISLVRLSGLVAKAVADIGLVIVEGEVQEPKWYANRAYFTLRDRTTQMSVTMPFRAQKPRLVKGERIAVTGRIEYTPNYGRLQLVALEVAPRGEGAIAAAIADARARLKAAGILDRPRRPMPRLPAVIGVVCGTDAAVRHDIESVVAVRFPGYPVEFVEVNVSGLGAGTAIAEGLLRLDARADVEVIILARGGGDAAQLLPFSDEALCQAIASCATPVVSAIGHERDRPLCDEVADLRCGTPSLAAAAVVPDARLLAVEIDRLVEEARAAAEARLHHAVLRVGRIDRSRALASGVAVAASRLDRVTARLGLVHPSRAVAPAAARLERAAPSGPARQRLADARLRVDHLAARMEALSPARVLDRGYAVVRTSTGDVVRDPAQAPSGTSLVVQVAGGRIAATSEGEVSA